MGLGIRAQLSPILASCLATVITVPGGLSWPGPSCELCDPETWYKTPVRMCVLQHPWQGCSPEWGGEGCCFFFLWGNQRLP